MTGPTRDEVHVTEYRLSNGLTFSGDARTPVAALVREIFRDDAYGPAFAKAPPPRPPLPARPVVLDIGANVGVFAVWAASPPRRARVFAVEPVPSSYALLEANTARNLPGAVHCLCAAVTGTVGRTVLYLDRSASCDTLVPPPTPAFAERTVGEIEVDSLTLAATFDVFSLRKCDVLKLDVEGSEYDILARATDDDLRRTTRLAIETHDYLHRGSSQLIRRRLEGAGFEIVRGAAPDMLFAYRC